MRFNVSVSVCLFAAMSGLMLSEPALAVKINPIFAPTYTGPDYGLGSVVTLTNNAAAQASIEAAASQISGLFTNNVTVNILYYGVHGGADGFIGAIQGSARNSADIECKIGVLKQIVQR